jgi:hypothetical protein
VDEPKSLNSIFKEKLFRVPDYQRGYAVVGDYELGVEVVGKPFAGEGHSQHETVGYHTSRRMVSLLVHVTSRVLSTLMPHSSQNGTCPAGPAHPPSSPSSSAAHSSHTAMIG